MKLAVAFFLVVFTSLHGHGGSSSMLKDLILNKLLYLVYDPKFELSSMVSSFLRLPLVTSGSCQGEKQYTINQVSDLTNHLEDLECIFAAGVSPTTVGLGYNYGTLLTAANTALTTPFAVGVYQGDYVVRAHCSGRDVFLGSLNIGGLGLGTAEWSIGPLPGEVAEGEYLDSTKDNLVMDFTQDVHETCKIEDDNFLTSATDFLPYRNPIPPVDNFVDIGRIVGRDSRDGGIIFLNKAMARDANMGFVTVMYYAMKNFDLNVNPGFMSGTPLTVPQNFTYSRDGIAAPMKRWKAILENSSRHYKTLLIKEMKSNPIMVAARVAPQKTVEILSKAPAEIQKLFAVVTLLEQAPFEIQHLILSPLRQGNSQPLEACIKFTPTQMTEFFSSDKSDEKTKLMDHLKALSIIPKYNEKVVHENVLKSNEQIGQIGGIKYSNDQGLLNVSPLLNIGNILREKMSGAVTNAASSFLGKFIEPQQKTLDSTKDAPAIMTSHNQEALLPLLANSQRPKIILKGAKTNEVHHPKSETDEQQQQHRDNAKSILSYLISSITSTLKNEESEKPPTIGSDLLSDIDQKIIEWLVPPKFLKGNEKTDIKDILKWVVPDKYWASVVDSENSEASESPKTTEFSINESSHFSETNGFEDSPSENSLINAATKEELKLLDLLNQLSQREYDDESPDQTDNEFTDLLKFNDLDSNESEVKSEKSFEAQNGRIDDSIQRRKLQETPAFEYPLQDDLVEKKNDQQQPSIEQQHHRQLQYNKTPSQSQPLQVNPEKPVRQHQNKEQQQQQRVHHESVLMLFPTITSNSLKFLDRLIPNMSHRNI